MQSVSNNPLVEEPFLKFEDNRVIQVVGQVDQSVAVCFEHWLLVFRLNGVAFVLYVQVIVLLAAEVLLDR